MGNKCKKCYDNNKTPDENDCKKCQKVIIDGVDVSGCEHYWNTKGLELCKINFDNNYYSNGLPLAEKCNDHKNCYYRQLKRLEAENETLKSQLDFAVQQKEVFEQKNKELKEKLEETRKQVIRYRSYYCRGCYEIAEENEKLKEENFKLGQFDIKKVTLVENRQLEAENKKLKKALEEINSIIDNDFINRYMELSFNEYDDILEQIEKICEVLKDE